MVIWREFETAAGLVYECGGSGFLNADVGLGKDSPILSCGCCTGSGERDSKSATNLVTLGIAEDWLSSILG